jgi:translocation and assembly module TamA
VYRRFFVALGVACGCGGAQRVHPAGADYLDAIRIEGNRALASGALEPALALHETIREGAAVDPYLLAADTERIRIAYSKRGFFEARVAARVERTGHAQTVVFAVIEGRRAATRVEIAGLPPELPLARARALIELDDGAPFDYEAYDAGKLALEAAVEDAGYAHAEVPATVLADAAAATATVRYAVAAGARSRFGAIRITGTARPQLVAAVRQRLTFAPGDRYSASALEQSQVQLYELGRFSTVQVVPDRSGGEVIDVTVELTESSRHELHGGGGALYDRATYEGRARGGFSVVPASQPLLTIATDLRAALTVPHGFDLDADEVEPKVRLLASLQRLDLFAPRVRGELAGGVDYQTVEAYHWTGEHVRLGLDAPLGPSWLRLHVGWLLQRLEFSGVHPVLRAQAGECPGEPPCPTIAEQLGLDRPHAPGEEAAPGRQRVGAYQASLIADLRDNPIEPRRGAYLDLRAGAGTRFAGSELRYLQLVPELRGYVALGEVVIAGRARVGAIFGDVPVTERYYSGGTSGQRGFSGRALSPMAIGAGDNPPSVVIGGAGLIETGVELRRRLGTLATWPIGANLFLDGGDVTETPEQLDPWNLYWAIGAGLWSQLGGVLKFRFEVGYRLNRTAPPDPIPATTAWSKLAWQLGVGENF